MANYLISFSENFANQAPCGGGSCKIAAANAQAALFKFFYSNYKNFKLLTLSDKDNEKLGLDNFGLIKTEKSLFIEANASIA